jgi:hypothetical protein
VLVLHAIGKRKRPLTRGSKADRPFAFPDISHPFLQNGPCFLAQNEVRLVECCVEVKAEFEDLNAVDDGGASRDLHSLVPHSSVKAMPGRHEVLRIK